MEELVRFAESEAVRAVSGRFVERPGVHGLVVDVDDDLLAAWAYYQRLLQRGLSPAEASETTDDMLRDLHNWPYRRQGPSRYPPWDPFVYGYPYDGPALDLKWRPSLWEEYRSAIDAPSADPFVLKVLLEPSADSWEYETPSDYSVRVVFEERPVADLLASPTDSHDPVPGGVSIGTPTASSTLGGVLEDDEGQRYGLSCAHAFGLQDQVSQASPQDCGRGRGIGRVTHRSELATSDTKPACNPDVAGAAANPYDFALVGFSPGVQSQQAVLGVGSVAGVGDARFGEQVQVAGKSTGQQSLWVGGFTITHRYRVTKVDSSGKASQSWAVLNGLFELKRGSLFRTFGRRPVQLGDSGAWVLRDSSEGPEWAGVVVAGNRQTGYALPSRRAIEWAQGVGLKLSC